MKHNKTRLKKQQRERNNTERCVKNPTASSGRSSLLNYTHTHTCLRLSVSPSLCLSVSLASMTAACSTSFCRDNLAIAVSMGLLNISDVNACQHRAYKMRFLTGLFDPNVTTPYRRINISEVGQPSSQLSSLNAARKVWLHMSEGLSEGLSEGVGEGLSEGRS